MTEEEFKLRVVENSSGCWIWNKALKTCRRGTHKYGWVTYQKKQMSAHRLSWILFRGEISKDNIVCHKCDVPACVNPEHLFIGTQSDNVNDMIAKKRKWIGISLRKSDGKPANAKLSDKDIKLVREMRSKGYIQKDIANRVGVTQSCISQLLRGVTNYAK